jgi:hypothetical protein
MKAINFDYDTYIRISYFGGSFSKNGNFNLNDLYFERRIYVDFESPK